MLASWIPSQKGKQLLRNINGFKSRIYRHNEAKTKIRHRKFFFKHQCFKIIDKIVFLFAYICWWIHFVVGYMLWLDIFCGQIPSVVDTF